MAEHVGTTATPSEEVNGAATATEADNTTANKDAKNAAPSASTEKPAEAQSTDKDTKAKPITQSSTTEGKKRKFTSDDRDWRTRRDEDNATSNTHTPHSSSNKKASKPYNENVKSDYTNVPESSDPASIRKQVEFYFSDSNLPTDRFLLQQTGGTENRPVPIKLLHSFKRMRHFQPYSAIVAALRESDVLVVNDDEEVARRTPIPANMLPDADSSVRVFDDVTRPRSVYVKGFGREGPTTQFDIEAFFAPYGPTNAIRLRRTVPEKVFKGSVFVEFDSEDTAKKFLELDPKPKFDGRDLLIMSKEEYVVKKAKEVAEGKIPGSQWRGRGGMRGGRGSSRGGGRGGRGGHRGGRHERRDDRGRDRHSGREKRSREDDDEDDRDDAATESKKQKLHDNTAADAGNPSDDTPTTGPPADKNPETQAGLAGST